MDTRSIHGIFDREDLPPELLFHIFGRLPPKAIFSAMQVSKAWQSLNDHHEVWKERVRHIPGGCECLAKRVTEEETDAKLIYQKLYLGKRTLPHMLSNIRQQALKREWQCAQLDLDYTDLTKLRVSLDDRGQYLCQFIFGENFFDKPFYIKSSPDTYDYYDNFESELTTLIAENQTRAFGFDSRNRIYYVLKFFDGDGTPFFALLGQRDSSSEVLRIFGRSDRFDFHLCRPFVTFLKKLVTESEAVFDSGPYKSDHHGKKFYIDRRG